MSVGDVAAILRDRSRARPERLLRLQGWRGDDLAAACAAGSAAQRVGPAICGAASLLLAATQSVPLGGLVAGTAAWGAVASNHPFESALGVWARRRGRTSLPPNRAAKRLGCALGTALTGASTVAFATGHVTTGTALALTVGSLATFVATTNLCVPSMIFVSIWGEQRSTERHLLDLTTARDLRSHDAHAA